MVDTSQWITTASPTRTRIPPAGAVPVPDPIRGTAAPAAEDIVFLGAGGAEPTLLAWPDARSTGRAQAIRRLDHGYSIYALAVSPRGIRLATGTRAGLILVYALEGHRPVADASPLFEVFHTQRFGCGVLSVAFVTDEILASGGQDGRIRLWDVARGTQLADLDAQQGAVVAMSPLGSLVLASLGTGGVLRAWDLDTLRLAFESEPVELPRIPALTGLDFHPASGLLMHASRSGDLHVYDTQREFAAHRVPAHRGEFCAVACGAEHIATAGLDDLTLKIWSPSLAGPAQEIAVSAPVVAVGWVGVGQVLTVLEDGSGRLCDTDDSRQVALQLPAENLRTCMGLPPGLTAQIRKRNERAWRDEQIKEATALMQHSGSESWGRILQITEQLRARGFSHEASLLLADAARADNRVLWELESRISFAAALGDSPVVLPTLSAIAELLERTHEPELAIEYHERVLHLEEDYQDSRERIRRLRAHPLMGITPDNCARGDLGKGELIHQELEKHTVLKRKFRWRVVFDVKPIGTERGSLSLEDVMESIRKDLKREQADAASGGLAQTAVVFGQERREIQWLYVSRVSDPLVAYALEIQIQSRSSRIIAYGVFDADRLDLCETADVAEHNQRVQEAWDRVTQSSATKTWLFEINALAGKAIRRVTARQRHGW